MKVILTTRFSKLSDQPEWAKRLGLTIVEELEEYWRFAYAFERLLAKQRLRLAAIAQKKKRRRRRSVPSQFREMPPR